MSTIRLWLMLNEWCHNQLIELLPPGSNAHGLSRLQHNPAKHEDETLSLPILAGDSQDCNTFR